MKILFFFFKGKKKISNILKINKGEEGKWSGKNKVFEILTIG